MRINRHRQFAIIMIAAIFVATSITIFAQKKMQISGTAMGTGTQLGGVISVDVHVSEYSTAEDQKALLAAFAEDGSEGLANALDKMSSKGRVAITGTLGFELTYIRVFQTPDGGRMIRFATNRPIRIGETWSSTRSMDYEIAMGEIIMPKGKGKMTGTLIPAGRVKLDKEGKIEIEAFQNPWNLTNLKVW